MKRRYFIRNGLLVPALGLVVPRMVRAQFSPLSPFAPKGVTVAANPPVIVNAWNGQGSSSASKAVTVSPTAGNLLVVCVGAFSTTEGLHTVVDNLGSTYVKVIGQNAGAVSESLWYLKNCPPGITTITVDSGLGAPSYTSAVVHEVSGCSTTAPFTTGEYTALGTGTTINPQTTSLAWATANSILFAALTTDPSLPTINGTGTTGTWNHFAAGSHCDGGVSEYMSVVNISQASAGSAVHGWATGNTTHPVIAVAFHP